ncbi:MAG: hypothetical protein RL757_736 [Bacteroidota bacterium]|jgi:hypothetical protein
MKRTFTKVLAVALATALGSATLEAQTILWPSTDSVQLNVSQFRGATSLRRDTNHVSTPGTWSTKGLYSDTLRKKDSAVWTYAPTGVISGLYTALTIVSPSVANGTVVFNSDFLDTRGTAAGTGSAPAGHAGEIVSPNINMVGQSGMVLKFSQAFRRFAGRTFITWSEDGGATWKPLIEVNGSEVAVNAVAAATVKTIPLSNSVGTANFRLKFLFDGRDAYPGANGLGYYAWGVDDVQLLSGGSDIKVLRSAGPANLTVPANQIEPSKYMASVTNSGTQTRDSVRVRARIFSSAAPATMLYDQNRLIGTLRVGDTAQYSLFPGTWPAAPATYIAPGVYNLQYIVTGAGNVADINTANDTVKYQFLVADTTAANTLGLNPAPLYAVTPAHRATYANELGSETTTRPALSGNNSWRAGNVFYVNNLRTRNGNIGLTFSHIIARVNNPGSPADALGINGQVVSARLYKWNDANGDGSAQPTERVLLASGDSTITASQPLGSDWFTFKLIDINTGNDFYTPTSAADTGAYLAMVEYTTTSTTRHMRLGWATSVDWEPRLDAGDSLRGTVNVRYAPMLGIAATDDWDPTTFGSQIGRPNNPFVFTPVVRLRALPFGKVATENVLPAEQKFSVFPNPADQFVNLRTDFAKVEDVIVVEIKDVSGREVKYMEFNNVGRDQYNINVSDFANGTYLMKVMTANGSRTEKFVVQH